MSKIKAFLIDYMQRHRHPVNACFHVVGVPAAFWGIYRLFTDSILEGLLLIVFGYFLQYLGHRAQGNEVGEVTLIKHVWALVRGGK